jgi:hypothetical protein
MLVRGQRHAISLSPGREEGIPTWTSDHSNRHGSKSNRNENLFIRITMSHEPHSSKLYCAEPASLSLAVSLYAHPYECTA